VADYTLKINEICDSMASIDVNIDESEKVQICLGGLASKFGAFRTAVYTGEYPVLFLLAVDAPCGGEPRGCGGYEHAHRQQTTWDPPEAGGVVASQPWIAGIVVRKATERASAGRSALSRGKPRPDPDPDEPTEETGSSRTTRKDPEKPEEPQPS
jgi:hypothetical protein